MIDFLGNEFDVGDYIVYPAGSGRSITMVKAQVVRFTESSVVVQPLDSARWQQHHETTQYRDTRTGKNFDPYAAAAMAHMQRDAGYVHRETGDYITRAQFDVMPWPDRQAYTYATTIWKDYVEKVKVGPKPVRLTITKNIIRVDA